MVCIGFSVLKDVNPNLEYEVARLNAQVVDLQGRVMHQSQDKASWKAAIMGKMNENVEGIGRQHLEEIRDCHHRLLWA